MLEQVDTVLARLPPSADKLGVAYRVRVDSWKASRAKAWAPFSVKLPQVMHSARTTSAVAPTLQTVPVQRQFTRMAEQSEAELHAKIEARITAS